MKVNDESERLLRAAMDRIVAGRPIRSSGSFTVTALAVEAGVSRRTAGRATGVLRDFREAGERSAKGPSSDNGERGRLRDELIDVRKKLADRSAEARRLRVDLETLACRVALLSEENAQLRAALGNGKVVPLPAIASHPSP